MAKDEDCTSPPPDGEDLRRAAEALDAADLHGLAWAWLGHLSRNLRTEDSTRAAAWARIAERLGAGAQDNETALMQMAVYGGAIHGVPPRTAEQWEFAASVMDPQTVEEMRAWAALDPGEPGGADLAEDVSSGQSP